MGEGEGVQMGKEGAAVITPEEGSNITSSDAVTIHSSGSGRTWGVGRRSCDHTRGGGETGLG
jgi:hypothetical protein